MAEQIAATHGGPFIDFPGGKLVSLHLSKTVKPATEEKTN
jgi:hypothetical protein